jgi:hypothetical protein
MESSPCHLEILRPRCTRAEFEKRHVDILYLSTWRDAVGSLDGGPRQHHGQVGFEPFQGVSTWPPNCSVVSAGIRLQRPRRHRVRGGAALLRHDSELTLRIGFRDQQTQITQCGE